MRFFILLAVIYASNGFAGTPISGPVPIPIIQSDGKACEQGYYRKGSSCLKLDIPQHGRPHPNGYWWTCKVGYAYIYSKQQCEEIVLPDNARLDNSGNWWTCNREYIAKDEGCVRKIDHSLDCYNGVELKSAEAVTSVIDCMANNSSLLAFEPSSALAGLSRMAATVPLDFKALQQALPPELGGSASRLYIKIIKQHQAKEGASFLLAHLAGELKQDSGRFQSLNALLDLDMPEQWMQAREIIDATYTTGEVSAARYRSAKHILDKHIANPDLRFAESHRRRETRLMDAERMAIDDEYREFRNLKNTAPQQYIAHTEIYLQKRSRLADKYAHVPASNGLRGSVKNSYLKLADFVRHQQNNSEKAASLIEIAAADNDQGWSWILLADIYYFDLDNPDKALEYYRKALHALRSAKQPSNAIELTLTQFLQTWLGHEIRFIETGQPFQGSLTQQEIGSFATFYYYFGNSMRANFELALQGRSGDRQAETEAMLALPPSHMSLITTVNHLLYFDPPETLLQYLAKHDPGGYLTACIFGLTMAGDDNESASGNPEQVRFNRVARSYFDSKGLRVIMAE